MTAVITEQTPPPLRGPSDKEKKYDRQLRLWGGEGQRALEDAHILLVNSGSGTVGVETLKNLVLPGIGKFTIWDNVKVTEADLGVNFFLDEESLGKSRAESCAQLLTELNPDVKGDWQPKEEGHKLENFLKDSEPLTLVLYSFPIEPYNLTLLQSYSKQKKVPSIAIHSAGFYSYFSLYFPHSFPIVDTHPDSTATTDLRLLTPWPALSEFAAELTRDIDNLSAHEHGHIPYLVLLLHYLNTWKAEHGTLPTTYKEKTEFRKLVSSAARTNTPEGGEENFEEAAAAVLKTVSVPELSQSVKEVFAHQPDTIESVSSFWIIANAIKTFYATHKELPLPGSVPDMKAQSSVYVQLQNLYKAKARQDVAEVLQTVRGHSNGGDIAVAEVELFCKNAAFIKLVHGAESSPTSIQAMAAKEFENDEMAAMTMMPLSLLPIYLSLSATSHVASASSFEILDTISKIVPDSSANKRLVDTAEEVARAEGGELHNISALTGGMVSQEVIKLITKQYIPIDNTCIFDGINSRTQVLRI